MRTAATSLTSTTTTMTIPTPGPGVAVRIQSAHVTLVPSAVVTAFAGTLRQRRSPDTWAEIELGTRARLWYLWLSPQLHARMVATGHFMLFPRQGREFFDLPVLDLVPGDVLVQPPPIGAVPAGYKVFTFPEIEGEIFMIRLGLTPEARRKLNPNAPNDPGWPASYQFSIQTSDLACFGPSYPATVELRFGAGQPAHSEPGTLLEPVRTPDLGPALQAAVDQAMGQKPKGAIAIPLTASSAAPGKLTLEIEADITLLVSAFSDGKPTHDLTLTESVHSGQVSLSLPAAGTPREATVEMVGSLVQSVVMTELGQEPSASGDDVIGIRLRRGVTYLQKLEVDTAYEVVAVDVRLAEGTSDTLLVVEARSAGSTSRGELRLPPTGRQPGWITIALGEPLALDPKGSQEIAVWVERGEVTWLCGRGDTRLALQRDDSVSPVRPVVDVTGGSPMTGRLRARTRRAHEELPLAVELRPGNHRLAPRDTQLGEDGSFRSKLDLTEALQEIVGGTVTIHVQSRAEGTIALRQPRIVYALHVKGSST